MSIFVLYYLYRKNIERLMILAKTEKTKNEQIILEIYEKYLRMMRGTAYKRIPDLDVVDDIVQDCMLKFIRHSDTLETLSEPQLISYIRITVEHTVTDYLRNNKPDMSLEDNIELVENLTIKEIHPIDEEIDLMVKKEQLVESIKKLKLKDRNLISLKYSMNLSDEQIAQTLGIKTSSVRMTLYRSLERLRKIAKELSKND